MIRIWWWCCWWWWRWWWRHDNDDDDDDDDDDDVDDDDDNYNGDVVDDDNDDYFNAFLLAYLGSPKARGLSGMSGHRLEKCEEHSTIDFEGGQWVCAAAQHRALFKVPSQVIQSMICVYVHMCTYIIYKYYVYIDTYYIKNTCHLLTKFKH